MSSIAELITSLKGFFTEYAGKSGNKETLSKRELAEMLHKEIPETKDMSKAEIEDFFDSLDEDSDGEVDFKQFVNFVVTLNMLYETV